MVMQRYEFLAQAHAIVKPRTYFEIGVQLGSSLALAEASEVAIGIDPVPLVVHQCQRPNQVVLTKTADEYFAPPPSGTSYLPAEFDFGFIDGSHLFEDALRDFYNVERHMRPMEYPPGSPVQITAGVIFLDDVLPYNAAIAAREQPPGDWTGDVWKLWYILSDYRPDLRLHLIDVAPTGLLMVQGAKRRGNDVLRLDYQQIVDRWCQTNAGDHDVSPPDEIISRTSAISADEALDILRERHAA
jgi:hypothetical protein